MAEMKMLERVARKCADIDMDESEWQHYVDTARDLLLALREPTEDVVTRALFEVPCSTSTEKMHLSWNAIINAILSEQL